MRKTDLTVIMLFTIALCFISTDSFAQYGTGRTHNPSSQRQQYQNGNTRNSRNNRNARTRQRNDNPQSDKLYFDMRYDTRWMTENDKK